MVTGRLPALTISSESVPATRWPTPVPVVTAGSVWFTSPSVPLLLPPP